MNKNYLLLTLLVTPLIGVLFIHQVSLISIIIQIGIGVMIWMLFKHCEQLSGIAKVFTKSLLFIFYFAFLFISMFEAALFDFSGKGFNNEVYFHIELESLRIAFTQYPIQLTGFIILVVFYVGLINFLLKNSNQKHKPKFLLSAVALICILLTFSPLSRFIKGFIDYTNQEQIEMDQAMIQHFIDLKVLNTVDLTTNFQLDAQAEHPKNLILLYLESFNQGLMQQPQFPDLTPNLNRLTNQFQPLTHLSSSYVTIEGIISSQCGTMLPMTAGNNTFLNNGQLLTTMPCLGDILKKAGYEQYYLGGAAMEFAGKGKFLAEHGYDHIWGSEYWFANGFKTPKGAWGLSDAELFENAISTIKKAAKTPPYNLTLLTLGTHLPGYSYKGCSPYPGSDEPFIHAIHCTDHLVGQFVDQLNKANLLDDTVLMIVADHGIFPTSKMKELFGDTVTDRQLIAITNYPHNIPDYPISSYDLAPTLLDMLGIEHNAEFLYGQSLITKTNDQQKFVTRYLDWHDGTMVNNNQGDCSDTNASEWPLNSCYKRQLIGLTSQLLEHYSVKDEPEDLLCTVNISVNAKKLDNGKESIDILLNDNNHFDHFYHEGYLLNSLGIKQGAFVFVLNDEHDVVNHIFFKHNPDQKDKYQQLISNAQSPILMISVADQEKAGHSFNVSVQYHHSGQIIWNETFAPSTLKTLKLCEN